MIRLDGLSGGNIVWIEPGRIDVVGRLDDAEREQLFPEVVHGGDRELRLGGEDAAIRIAPRFAAARLLAGHQERRIDAVLTSDRYARGLVAGVRIQVVRASGAVADRETRLVIARRRPSGRPARKEGRVAPEVVTGMRLQIDVDCFQMSEAVVAGKALYRHSEKPLARFGSEVVVPLLRRPVRLNLAPPEIRRSVREAVT